MVGVLRLRIDEGHAHLRGRRSGRHEIQVADFKSTLVRVKDDTGRAFLEEHVFNGHRLPAAGHAKRDELDVGTDVLALHLEVNQARRLPHGHPHLDVVESSGSHVHGVLHPLVGGQPADLVPVVVDGVVGEGDVHPVVAVLPPGIPLGVVAGGHVVIGHLDVPIGGSDDAHVEVRRVNDPRHRAHLPTVGNGLIGLHLTEHGVGHIRLEPAVLEFELLRQIHQDGRGLFRGGRSGIATPIIEEVLIPVGLFDREAPGDAGHLLQRPPGPPDVEVLEQVDGIAEPHIGVLSTLAEVQWHVVRVADARGEVHRPDIVVAPILVGRVDQLVIPRRGQAREIIGPPVALDEDDVVGVDGADAVGALFVEVP